MKMSFPSKSAGSVWIESKSRTSDWSICNGPNIKHEHLRSEIGAVDRLGTRNALWTRVSSRTRRQVSSNAQSFWAGHGAVRRASWATMCWTRWTTTAALLVLLCSVNRINSGKKLSLEMHCQTMYECSLKRTWVSPSTKSLWQTTLQNLSSWAYKA